MVSMYLFPASIDTQHATEDPAVVKARWADALILLNFSMDCAAEQVRRRQRFVFEHPAGATSWKQPSVNRVRQLPGVYEVVFDMCQFGLCTKVNYHASKNPKQLRANSNTIKFKGYKSK